MAGARAGEAIVRDNPRSQTLDVGLKNRYAHADNMDTYPICSWTESL
jgi:hypothetical protein